MRRIGVVWCSVVTLLVMFVELLTLDLSEPRSDWLLMRLVDGLHPWLAAAIVPVVILSAIVLVSAILREAWNRIAPHILDGARTMTFAEAYAVGIVASFVF